MCALRLGATSEEKSASVKTRVDVSSAVLRQPNRESVSFSRASFDSNNAKDAVPVRTYSREKAASHFTRNLLTIPCHNNSFQNVVNLPAGLHAAAALYVSGGKNVQIASKIPTATVRLQPQPLLTMDVHAEVINTAEVEIEIEEQPFPHLSQPPDGAGPSKDDYDTLAKQPSDEDERPDDASVPAVEPDEDDQMVGVEISEFNDRFDSVKEIINAYVDYYETQKRLKERQLYFASQPQQPTRKRGRYAAADLEVNDGKMIRPKRTGNNVKRHQCPHCGYRTHARGRLVTHLAKKHDGVDEATILAKVTAAVANSEPPKSASTSSAEVPEAAPEAVEDDETLGPEKVMEREENLTNEDKGSEKGGYKITCSWCGVRFVDPIAFKDHQMNFSYSCRRFQCARCNLTSLSEKSIIRHQIKRDHGRAVLCRGCNLVMDSHVELYNHIHQVH